MYILHVYIGTRDGDREHSDKKNDLLALQKPVAEDNDMDGGGVKGGKGANQLLGMYRWE